MRQSIKKRLRIAAVCTLLLAGFIWLNNTNLFTTPGPGGPKFLAHRGLAQTFDMAKVDWDTNTAAIMDPPEHPYLENTLPSMAAAFDYGADLVELDIQLTADGQLAVFHDNVLEYRTDGSGKVGDYTMAQLKRLDVGYGYTADNGESYPFRGQGVGLMPSLDQVLEQFPERDLLLHIKESNVAVAQVLWRDYLQPMTPAQRARVAVYGDGGAVDYLREQSPSLRLMSYESLKRGLLQYELLGWTGYVPGSIRNMELHVPAKYAKYLWGWPGKFVSRMERYNTRVVLVDGNGKMSEGFDSRDDLEKIPAGYSGYIWTNRIDLVMP